MPRTVSVHCAAIPDLQGASALTFVRLVGEEAVGSLGMYTLELKTPDEQNPVAGAAANLDLKSFVGQECTVSIALEGKGMGATGGMGAGVREISGLVTEARIIRAEGRNIVYGLTLRPWLWLATRTSDYKIFQEKSVTDILDEVLGEYGFPVEKRLTGEYPRREYQVQYGETDFQFLQRLMQEWGIYWFFEHADNKHRLVLCDHPGGHKPFSSPAYHTLSLYPHASKTEEEYLHLFEAAESLTPGAWVSNDFDFTKPLADLTAMSKQPRETTHADGELYEWPGDYMIPGEGEILARIRMEEKRAPGSKAQGAGNVRAVVPGCTFTLVNHPHEAANIEYLILQARFELEDVAEETGYQSYRHHVTFEAQPLSEPYRPERVFSKPRTRGPQTAVVTGPSGQEIWTDKYGRVKVQFHWDRYGAQDEHSSCWVRVSQPWAGSHFGAMYLPRIGQEVVVDFLNGDPDLPLITGRVYNAMNMPPWSLPDNATQSGVLTRSSKEGTEANANALRFEDKKGEEEIWLHAEKDRRIEVENDETHWVGHDRGKKVDHDEAVFVGHDRTEEVGNDESVTIGNNQSLLVKHDQTTTVNNNQSLTVLNDRGKQVLNNETDLIAKMWTISVGVQKAETVGVDVIESIGVSRTETVGALKTSTVGNSYTLSVGKSISTTTTKRDDTIGKSLEQQIGETWKCSVGKTLTLDVGDKIEITCGESSLTMDKKGNIALKGKDFLFDADGKQQIRAGGNVVLKGKKILEN